MCRLYQLKRWSIEEEKMGSDEEWITVDDQMGLEEMRRQKEEIKFLDLCKEGGVESMKTLLVEDPSLINSKDDGKSYMQ